MQTPNRGFRHREQIGHAESGKTVWAHLTARYSRATEGEWGDRLHMGQVFLDDLPAAGSEVLRAGQWLVWARPPWVEPDVPLTTAILYEDDDLLAVAKPSGLPTLPAGGAFLEHTLLALVRQRCPEASPMHRLGRGTSGIVLFARTAEARCLVQERFRSHTMNKIYVALCSGHPPQGSFSVEVPIGEVAHPLLGTIHAASLGGRASFSEVRVLEARPTSSLVEVTIRTGRPHQIRIHLAAAGHPLVGDPLYGPGGVPLADSTALPGDLGYLLHAGRLAFLHPRIGSPIDIHCQAPPALRVGGEG